MSAADEPRSDADELDHWRDIGARLLALDPLYFVRLSTTIEVATIARETAKAKAVQS